jgi:hypothetical protein
MATYKSTMGAPLTDDEEARIRDAWNALWETAHLPALTQLNPGFDRGILEPVEMLNHATNLVLAIQELRVAISEGWYYANKRAFPGPVPKPRVSSSEFASEILKLGFTDEEINAAIAQIRAERTAK